MTAAKKEDLRLLVASGIFVGEFEQNQDLVQVVLTHPGRLSFALRNSPVGPRKGRCSSHPGKPILPEQPFERDAHEHPQRPQAAGAWRWRHRVHAQEVRSELRKQ